MFDYSFAVARIAAMESSLITKDAISRMNAQNGKEALRLISASGYGRGDTEDPVDSELSFVRGFIAENLPEELARILLLPYDCHNLKVLLKSRGQDVSGALYDNTVFDTEIAAACCRGGEFSLLSRHIADVLDPAFDSGKLTSPFDISTLCDLAFYGEIDVLAKKAPELIKKYVAAEADHINYISYLRAKNIGLSGGDLKKAMIPGGDLPASVLCKAYADGADDIKEYTFGYSAHDAISAAQEAAKTSISAAKDRLDEYSERLLEKEKYETNSPVPVFLFYKKKIREARLVREYLAGSQEALWKRK